MLKNFYTTYLILHCNSNRYFKWPNFIIISYTAGTDYGDINQTLVFPATSDSRILCVNITIFSDGILEGEENFLVSLTTNDLTVTLATAEVFIADDGMVVSNTEY